MHGVTVSPFSGYSTRKVWFLIRSLISLRVAFSQGLFMSSDNLVDSEKFLGYGMKWEIYEPDSPKCGQYCEISFATVLNTLCKPLPIFCVVFNTPVRSDCLCLIQSLIL